MRGSDLEPTHTYQGYAVRCGVHMLPGASIVPGGGINFSVFSFNASFCVLVLLKKGNATPLIEIPFQGVFNSLQTNDICWCDFRIGSFFTIVIFGLNYEEIEYGFRMGGDYPKIERGKPGIHRFDTSYVLLDPYAKGIGGRDVWGKKSEVQHSFIHRGRIIQEDYDWESDYQLEIPMEDLIIYEMHVRGFTRDFSAKVKYPGTFHAIYEKIPYLKELGVNCVEFMPIAEFDEFENERINNAGEPLLNYWGYSPLGLFAPKAGYAACGKFQDATLVADELKSLVKELHKNGIEVILDVVFNHTAEGNENGKVISFRGIDNSTFYLLTPEGWYYNFSGTGNTINCNNPIMRNLLLDCLRYWVVEYHIDGFRFDLASILSRDHAGAPMANPPLLETLSFDPILSKCKLIAESWDASGLYQVGCFPAYGRWAEWNGLYRDTVRKFVKGDPGLTDAMAQCLQGSKHLYKSYHRTASVNFITCHDGFTLNDLVSYDKKHNEANGEQNQDGMNDNNSWNCGYEGITDDIHVNQLRTRQIKNFFSILLISKGIPMIYMGDEMRRTQLGNNNAYCLDNPINWLDWNLLKKNQDIFRFVKYFIEFRKCYPMLRNTVEVVYTWYTDWADSTTVAFMMNEKKSARNDAKGEFIYVALNMHWTEHGFHLPRLPMQLGWHVFTNTMMPSPEDIWSPGNEAPLENSDIFLLGPHSLCVLVGKLKSQNLGGNP